DTRWRRNSVVGMLLACSGVIGLWGIGFFSIDLTRSVFQKAFTAEGMDPAKIPGQLTFWAGATSVMLNLGAFFGIYGFSVVSQRIGRRPTFAVAFLLAMTSTAAVFLWLKERSEIFWMIPLMGFFQLSLFGGYAIYFPELFPTRLRSTGTSFCYNVGRLIAAGGPEMLGFLTSVVFAAYDAPWPFRLAGVAMCSVFAVGLIVLANAGTAVVRLLKLVIAFCSIVSGWSRAPRRCVWRFHSASLSNSAAKCGSQNAMWQTRPMPKIVTSFAPFFLRSPICWP